MKMEYETPDTYFAAFLMVAGVRLSGSLMRAEDNRVYFIFEHPGVHIIKDLKHSYFSGSGSVQALAFSQYLKHLRSLVSNSRK